MCAALTTNSLADVGWTDKMHTKAGNIAMSDGSVQQKTVSGLKSALPLTQDATVGAGNVLYFP